MPHILIVEDDEDNRDMLSRRLMRRGYTTSIAVDGETAIAMAREQSFDLILMDISLPGVDGIEATCRILEQAGGRRVPVLALTAHATAATRALCMAAGFVEFDTKPVLLDRLMAKMEAVLNQVDRAGLKPT